MDEFPVVLGVLLGLRANCELRNHGEQNKKGITVENQKTKCFGRVFGGADEKIRAVPMEPEDAFQVVARLLSQLKAQWPGLDAGELSALVKVMTPMLAGKHGMRGTGGSAREVQPCS